MSDESDESQPRMVFFDQTTGQPITAEQHAELLARQQMSEQDFHTSVRRLFFVELADDQLETVRRLFRTLGNMEDPKAWVNYYEGLVDGAYHSREFAAQLTPSRAEPEIPDAEQFFEVGTLAEHPWEPAPSGHPWECGFSARVEGIENAVDCGLPPQAKPHTDWAKNLTT